MTSHGAYKQCQERAKFNVKYPKNAKIHWRGALMMP